MPNYSNYENLAINAAHLGGEVLKKYFNKVVNFEVKPEAGIVTQADKESEIVISALFNKETPGFSILGEESGLTENDKNIKGKWIIDPLDGTTNFFHGFPHFNVSIALELDDEIVAGVVYNPITDETYHCSKGNGAYINSKKISVSKTNDLASSMLGTGFAYQRGDILDEALAMFKRFTYAAHGVRRPGAAALDLCYVARGIYDGFYEKTLNAWDVAAGSLLIKEAGGKVSNYNGKSFSVYSKSIVASNAVIHDEMIEIINS
ncbi:MAG: inositol monophosphatase family protein [bacterium]